MDVIEFSRVIFNQRQYNNVPDAIKKKHFFIINRFLSNRYPLEVNKINNNLLINRKHIPILMDWWQRFLSTRYTSQPCWFFIKTSLAAAKKDKISKIKKDIIKQYQIKHNVTNLQFKFMREEFEDELYNEIKMFEKQQQYYSRKKPKKK